MTEAPEVGCASSPILDAGFGREKAPLYITSARWLRSNNRVVMPRTKMEDPACFDQGSWTPGRGLFGQSKGRSLRCSFELDDRKMLGAPVVGHDKHGARARLTTLAACRPVSSWFKTPFRVRRSKMMVDLQRRPALECLMWAVLVEPGCIYRDVGPHSA